MLGAGASPSSPQKFDHSPYSGEGSFATTVRLVAVTIGTLAAQSVKLLVGSEVVLNPAA